MYSLVWGLWDLEVSSLTGSQCTSGRFFCPLWTVPSVQNCAVKENGHNHAHMRGRFATQCIAIVGWVCLLPGNLGNGCRKHHLLYRLNSHLVVAQILVTCSCFLYKSTQYNRKQVQICTNCTNTNDHRFGQNLLK